MIEPCGAFFGENGSFVVAGGLFYGTGTKYTVQLYNINSIIYVIIYIYIYMDIHLFMKHFVGTGRL